MKRTVLPFSEKVKAHWTPERTAKVTGNKKVFFQPAEAAPLLRALGLLNADASMPADAVRKFMQINHMLELLKPKMLDLKERFKVVRVLDCGCGNSYLTFLLAWAFKHVWRHPAAIVGIDTNAKAIARCKERADELGLGDLLAFECVSVKDFMDKVSGEGERFHAVVALHACDTATDDALSLALAIKADVIAVAPCCQAELASQWRTLSGQNMKHAMAAVMRSHELRRDIASSFTDALRLLLLRGCGYETQAMEFVPSAHTPKNRLIVSSRRGNFSDEALVEYVELKKALGDVTISLEKSLPPHVLGRLPSARDSDGAGDFVG